jgi:hypothetical protein
VELAYVYVRVEVTEDEQVMLETCKGKGHPITGHEGPRGGVEL